MGKPNKGWCTAEEKRYISSNWPRLTKTQLAKDLGRSKTFIKEVIRDLHRPCQIDHMDLPPYNNKMMERISNKLEYIGDCWIAPKNAIQINNREYKLSRILYYWHKNIKLDGVNLVNECMNPKCVNPNHFGVERPRKRL